MLAQSENVPFLQSENVPFLVLTGEGLRMDLGILAMSSGERERSFVVRQMAESVGYRGRRARSGWGSVCGR
jgi:hypothetical protein